MRMHGRNMVSIRRLVKEKVFCTRCSHDHTTRDALRIKYSPKATMCDKDDPAFALCEVCWFRWDAEESGLSRTLIANGINAFVASEQGALVRRSAGGILAQISDALEASGRCG